ncbi:RCC1 domain-containing protein 1 [Prorops nasuta]|uniref:RCC1 domain-containing protein 1 n=1 Tax=Prorops nasuta TaxID=863751 RepID=UPI0034CE7925
MKFYYAGLNNSYLFSEKHRLVPIVDKFTEILIDDISKVEIGWNYFLIWKNEGLYITHSNSENVTNVDELLELLQSPDNTGDIFKDAAPGKDSILLLSNNHKLWQYKYYEKLWKLVPTLISTQKDSEHEYLVKVDQGNAALALTNLGRAFSIPLLLDMPKRIKFVDVACGFDHTIFLTNNGEVFSMGIGTRGQLGHNDLEDCDNPKEICALAGLRIVKISAGGWHSAVLTDQGDLYSWGWNTNGELGIEGCSSDVQAIPVPVDFKNEKGEIIESNVKDVQCGNAFTICLMEDKSFWGCGSNKYGQLGMDRKMLTSTRNFIKLDVNFGSRTVKNFKCREWGTVITVD